MPENRRDTGMILTGKQFKALEKCASKDRSREVLTTMKVENGSAYVTDLYKLVKFTPKDQDIIQEDHVVNMREVHCLTKDVMDTNELPQYSHPSSEYPAVKSLLRNTKIENYERVGVFTVDHLLDLLTCAKGLGVKYVEIAKSTSGKEWKPLRVHGMNPTKTGDSDGVFEACIMPVRAG